MSQSNNSESKAFEADGAIALGDLVKFDADGKITVCGVGDTPIGQANEPADAADVIGVRLLNQGGTLRLRTAGAVARGATVYARAAGEVDDDNSSSAVAVGSALEAASAADEYIEVLLG